MTTQHPPRLCPHGCGVRMYGPNDPHDCTAPTELGPATKGHYPEPVRLPMNDPRAARWSLYAAHALSGLLASDLQASGETVLNWAKLAATHADQLLAEHNTRFSATQLEPPPAPAPGPRPPLAAKSAGSPSPPRPQGR